MNKRLPLGYTKAKTEGLKKFHFVFGAKKGVMHEGGYTRGVIHEALQYVMNKLNTMPKSRRCVQFSLHSDKIFVWRGLERTSALSFVRVL